MKTILPATWKVPAVFRARLGEGAGRQRAMSAEGHLLLVLHEPPQEDHAQRAGRLFWRDAEGAWKSNTLGVGIQSLRSHITEFADRTDKLEEQLQTAAGADDYFALLQAIAPLHRTVRNLHAALQQAREMAPDDRDLITLRDQSGDLERAAELLHGDAKNGLDYTVARQTEEQTRRSYEMAVAAHRLNMLAAVFFPIAALTSIFGMNLAHPLETLPAPLPFWGVLAVGFVGGLMLTLAVARRPLAPLQHTQGVRKQRGFGELHRDPAVRRENVARQA